MGSSPVVGLLFSQIGYDLGDPMRALVRSTDPGFVPKDAVFEIRHAASGEVAFSGPVNLWGLKWGSSWWEMDFTGLSEGEYDLALVSGGRDMLRDGPLKVGRHLLWNETVGPVALDQFEERALKARNGKGWKDCGADWREANSHASAIIGLCDLLNTGFEWMSGDDVPRLIAQIIHGCDYLCICQDKAEDIGLPKGAMVHEIPNHMITIPGDIAQTATALAYASRLLTDMDRGKSREYLDRAVSAYEYALRRMRPFGPSGFSHSNHGAPEGFRVPGDFMTRDLLMLMYGGVQLCASGLDYKDDVKRLAKRVMRRQVPRDKAEGGLYGHFYTFDDCGFTEKANIHHHVGHDTGTSFPYYVIPFIEMVGRWYDDPEVEEWRGTIGDFARGFFIPACKENPFHIIPEGYFLGEGLLFFAGPWHGINGSIALGATLATRLRMCVDDPELRRIAVGCMQWIAGMNSGMTKEAFKGCVLWHAEDEVPEGKALPYSQIVGIGNRSVKGWAGIKGSILNGFSVNPQFQLSVPPTADNDGPWLYADEDWIPHAAGWLSALSYLRQAKFFEGM